MIFLLTGRQGEDVKQIIVNELQATQAIEKFMRIAVSLEETSYHLQSVSVMNKVKRGNPQGMSHQGRTLSIQIQEAPPL